MPVLLPSWYSAVMTLDGGNERPYPSLGQEGTPVCILPGRQNPGLHVSIALEHLTAAEQQRERLRCELKLPLRPIAHSLVKELSHLREQHGSGVRVTVF